MDERAKREKFRENFRKGFTFWLKTEQAFKSDDLHIFVIISNGQDGDPLIMVNGTSQVEKAKRRMRMRGQNVSSTSVEFKKNDYSFLSKNTIFDCNCVSEVNAYKINFKNNVEFLKDGFSEEDVARLVLAVVNSDSVPEYIKRIVRRD